MYISRVEIDLNNRQKIRGLDNLQAYHNWVESAFPHEIKHNIRSRKLWRIDKLQGKQYLIIISQDEPEMEALEVYGVKATGLSKPYNEFLDTLKNGQTLRFKATLNPVISKSTGKMSEKRGHVMPHITVDQKMKYLKDRSEKNGFFLKDDEFFVTESSIEPLKKCGQKPVEISKVTYEGQLTILDVSAFRETLINGLGKEKAYGCGMLTVIPIQST